MSMTRLTATAIPRMNGKSGQAALLALGILCAIPYAAQAQDAQTVNDIKALYQTRAEILTGEKVDVSRAIAEAKAHNTEDARFVNRLENVKTGKVSERSMTKAEMISQMHEAYGLMADNEADINVTGITENKAQGGYDVNYTLDYNATLQQKDVYGRMMAAEMDMTSTCVDRVIRNEQNILQTAHSACDAMLDYTVPQIKTGQ